MHNAIDGVGIDVIRKYLERIGMHEERVALRIIYRHGFLGCHGITRSLIVFAIVTQEHVLIDGVIKLHIAKSIAHAALAAVIDTVANHGTSVIAYHRTVKQFRVVGLRVIVAVL